eukprot:scaffold1509_cov240-Pinguiococcus_pyrenoidosus.AAC.47
MLKLQLEGGRRSDVCVSRRKERPRRAWLTGCCPSWASEGLADLYFGSMRARVALFGAVTLCSVALSSSADFFGTRSHGRGAYGGPRQPDNEFYDVLNVER